MGGPARHGNTVTVAGRRITVCRPGIVRVASGDGPAAGPPSLVAPRDWPEAPFDVGGGRVRLDRLGTMRQLWNTQLGHGPGSDLGVPLLLSNRGYAVFFDTPADASVAVGRSDGGVRITYTAARGPLAWYVLVAADLRALLGEVAALLGPAAMPPRWALGFLPSTRHFEDTEELRRLPRTIRDKRIPCDALIYLSSYGEALGWNRGVGHLEFQPELWPKPAALLDEARTQHFEVVTHEWCARRGGLQGTASIAGQR